MQPTHSSIPIRGLIAACILLSLPARVLAQGSAALDTRPTVAIMDFDNAALLNHAEYESLGKGIAGILNTELSANAAIRVVDRENIRRLLDEQALGSSKQVSAETALHLGKLLGAHHMIFGVFLVSPRGRMRLDVRAVDVETSRVEYVTSRTAEADDMLTLIADVAQTMNAGMKLSPLLPSTSRTSRTSAAPAPDGTRMRAVRLYSRALEEQDRGNLQQATAFCREALTLLPDFVPARQALDRLEKPGM